MKGRLCLGQAGRAWDLQCVLWLAASFEQVAGCLLSCLPFPAIHQLSYYCLEPASGYKRSETPLRKSPRFYVVRTLWGISNTPLMTGIMKQ